MAWLKTLKNSARKEALGFADRDVWNKEKSHCCNGGDKLLCAQVFADRESWDVCANSLKISMTSGRRKILVAALHQASLVFKLCQPRGASNCLARASSRVAR